jgi:hypothetical protein
MSFILVRKPVPSFDTAPLHSVKKSPAAQNADTQPQKPGSTVPALGTVYAEFRNERIPEAIWPEDWVTAWLTI